MDKLTKIYVTKYALTAGPFSVMAEVKPGGRSACWSEGWGKTLVFRKDFCLSKEDALADCERRRAEKLGTISSEKQAKRIRAITFEIKEG